MFQWNDDMSIYATRGDVVFFDVEAEDKITGLNYKFQPGDVVRFKVYGKKNCKDVVMHKDFPVTAVTEKVGIMLEREDTKIGDVINKPKDYWYSVTLNDDTEPRTFIGYDEDGAKLFRLFPEGADIPPYEPKPEDVSVMDTELDMTSTKPVQNQAIARAIESLKANVLKVVSTADKQTVTFNVDAHASIMYSTFEQSGIVSVKGDLSEAPVITALHGDAPTLSYNSSAKTLTLTFPWYRTITFVTKYTIAE